MHTSSRPRHRSLLRAPRAALAVLVIMGIGLIASGCRAAGAAGPTPATFSGVAVSMRARGISFSNVVSGEAGCTDRTLVSAAIAFDASGLDQTTTVRVHLYTFGNGSAYNRLAHLVDACAAAYPGSGAWTRVDLVPYVAAGRGTWGTEFKQALKTALADAEPLGP